jgi:hypothetical protein
MLRDKMPSFLASSPISLAANHHNAPTSHVVMSDSFSPHCLCAECLHGMWMPWDNAKAATFFPQPIGLAATWDTDFMEEVAGIISEEMRAINNEQYKLDKTHRYCIAR